MSLSNFLAEQRRKKREVAKAYGEVPAMLKEGAGHAVAVGKIYGGKARDFSKTALAPSKETRKTASRVYRKIPVAMAAALAQRRRVETERRQEAIQKPRPLPQKPTGYFEQLRLREIQILEQKLAETKDSHANAVNRRQAQKDRIKELKHQLMLNTQILSAPHVFQGHKALDLLKEDIRLDDNVFSREVPNILHAPNVVTSTRAKVLDTKRGGNDINFADNLFSLENRKRRGADLKW